MQNTTIIYQETGRVRWVRADHPHAAPAQRNQLADAHRHAYGLVKSAAFLEVALGVHSRRPQPCISPYAADNIRYHIECAYNHLAEIERLLSPFIEDIDGSNTDIGDHCRHHLADH